MTTRTGPLRPALVARRAVFGGIIGVLAVVALSGCSSSSSSSLSSSSAVTSGAPSAPDLNGSLFVQAEPFIQLTPGQCTDVSSTTIVYDTVDILDCDNPHGSEVYNTFTFPAGDYPSTSQLNSVGDARCGGAFDSGVPSSLTYVWFSPTEEEWAAGNRFVACFAIDANNRALSAPLATLANEGPLSAFDRGTLAPALGLILAATAGIVFVSFLVSYLLFAASLASLFRKTGIPAWKAWVPFVQTWTLLRLGGQSGNWMWLGFVPGGSVVSSVFIYIGMYRIGIAFRKDSGMLVLGIFLPFVWAFILGGRDEQYAPELLALHGYQPPLEGYGSTPSRASGFGDD
ncbi:septum formation family protein [Cryobacterium breve]|uniref:Septum formation family protein n=1 Tax=Cryobacterium breve TaxID=1259258 RepID=A0ABY7NHC0_9MICO|nr:DUF5684 domain-containing protein [Cryobacterium breve]WBM80256.1 septum formation family protein [Cryobacterium breve]